MECLQKTKQIIAIHQVQYLNQNQSNIYALIELSLYFMVSYLYRVLYSNVKIKLRLLISKLH
jgi:hypothetical protein